MSLGRKRTTRWALPVRDCRAQRRGGATFESLNPANEEVIAICASGQAEDVDAAVKAAKAW